MFELIALALSLGISGNLIAIFTGQKIGEYMVLASAALTLIIALSI